MGLEPQMLARNQHGRGLYQVLREDCGGGGRTLRKNYRQIVADFFQTALGRASQKAFRRRDRKPLRNFPLTHLFLKRSLQSLINRRPRFRFFLSYSFQIACHPVEATQLIESFDLAPKPIPHSPADQTLIVRFRKSSVQNREAPRISTARVASVALSVCPLTAVTLATARGTDPS